MFHFLTRFPQRCKNYPRKWFHFLTSLKSENHAQVWFHFLTSLKSENHAQRPLFHFLTRLPQRHKKLSSKTSVSFFNEVVTETQKLSSNYPQVVSFFNKLEIRKPCSKTSLLDHGFQEDNALE
jgi:hypothetical protein